MVCKTDRIWLCHNKRYVKQTEYGYVTIKGLCRKKLGKLDLIIFNGGKRCGYLDFVIYLVGKSMEI